MDKVNMQYKNMSERIKFEILKNILPTHPDFVVAQAEVKKYLSTLRAKLLLAEKEPQLKKVIDGEIAYLISTIELMGDMYRFKIDYTSDILQHSFTCYIHAKTPIAARVKFNKFGTECRVVSCIQEDIVEPKYA